jgi:hypothetical protein
MSSISKRYLENNVDHSRWISSKVRRYEVFSRQPLDANTPHLIKGALRLAQWGPLPLCGNGLAARELNGATIDVLQDKTEETCCRCRKINFKSEGQNLSGNRRSAYLLGSFESIIESS